jgi:hypothetical protein
VPLVLHRPHRRSDLLADPVRPDQFGVLVHPVKQINTRPGMPIRRLHVSLSKRHPLCGFRAQLSRYEKRPCLENADPVCVFRAGQVKARCEVTNKVTFSSTKLYTRY